MKKYIPLIFAGLVAVLGLVYLGKNSKSNLASTHHDTLNYFANAKQSDVSTVQEVLKSRGFLALNFDGIVHSATEMEGLCEKLKQVRKDLLKEEDSTFDVAMTDYCQTVERKLSDIESFKSKNAVFRNSLFYLHRLASDEPVYQKIFSKAPVTSKLTRGLMRSTITFATISTPESRQLLSEYVRQVESLPAHRRDADLSMILMHSKNILGSKDDVERTIDLILAPTSLHKLDRLRGLYFERYSHSVKTANIYRNILVATGYILLALVVICIAKVIAMARALILANSKLEDRVRERTLELQESKNTIIHQQQSLIATAKMSALGEMAGGVAHEINNPLSIISMKVEQMSEILEGTEIDKLFLQSSLETVMRTTHRIAKIVSGLRFFARDGQREAFQVSSLRSLVDETLAFCREKFANHGVDVDIDEALEKSLLVECRAVEISQVILNLLNNSFDAVQSFDQKWIRVSAEDHPDFVKLTITDCGNGIPKEVQDKMMQPFFTTKEIGKGTGLGLSISRGIIESHKGQLFVDASCPNTRFVIQLPKFQSAQAPSILPLNRTAA